jgi:aryl-alcohol dehydrogenase-like predicted oxidoreductase
LSRKHILASVEASLARLNVDYLDLLLIHRWDAWTPIEETLRTLEGLVRAGKVRYLGASSMSAWRFMKALSMQRQLGFEPFVCMQNYYNLMYREEEREMLPLCMEEGVGVTPWSPLARGLLAGAAVDASRLQGDRLAHERYDARKDDPVIERLSAVAAARGNAPAQVALAWLLAKPAIVAPVLGFSDARQIELTCAALTLQLTTAELAALEEPYQPHPVIGFEPESARD